jgi:casein kinase II subunit beta
MILDVEPEEEDEDDEIEEDEENEDSNDDPAARARPNATTAANNTTNPERRAHSRIASDLSVIESSAEMLYGLIHQRFICSRAGIQQMSEKYEMGHFGVCPRTNCNLARALPVGLSDIPGEDTVKLFCPSCLDVYVPPNSRFQTVDGAFFGRTFGALFLLTFPEYDLTKHGVDGIAQMNNSQNLSGGGNGSRAGSVLSEENALVNGVYARNIAPGLGRGKIYEPRIYGFRVSEMARSGPRMQWLRDKPDDVAELDESRRFVEEHGVVDAGGMSEDEEEEDDPEEEDEEEIDDDESMNLNGDGVVAEDGTAFPAQVARRPHRSGGGGGNGNGARTRPQRQDQNGSPMAIETNGAESEL